MGGELHQFNSVVRVHGYRVCARCGGRSRGRGGVRAVASQATSSTKLLMGTKEHRYAHSIQQG
jgi:hypothetical protein